MTNTIVAANKIAAAITRHEDLVEPHEESDDEDEDDGTLVRNDFSLGGAISSSGMPWRVLELMMFRRLFICFLKWFYEQIIVVPKFCIGTQPS